MVLEGLSELGRKLWNFLISAVRRGVGAEGWHEATREFYPSYTFDEAFEDYVRADITYRESEKMRFYRRDYVIGRDRYIPADLTGKSRYQTVIEFKVRDPETGDIFTTGKTVKHNRVMTRGELEEKALGLEEKYEPEYEVISAMPAYGFRDLNYPGEFG